MKWDYDRNLPVEGTYNKRGLFWDEFFLSGMHHQVSSKELDEIMYYVFRDAYNSCSKDDPMKDFLLDYRMSFLYLSCPQPEHWLNHSGHITYADINCRLYFCDCENDVFDLVVDGACSPLEFVEMLSLLPDDDGIVPFSASMVRLKRFLIWLQSRHHPDADVITSCAQQSILAQEEAYKDNMVDHPSLFDDVDDVPIYMKEMREGDMLTDTICGEEIVGTLDCLRPESIGIKIISPLECHISRTLTHKQQLKVLWAGWDEDKCIATSPGKRMAHILFKTLSQQLCHLIDNTSAMKSFIDKYLEARESIIEQIQSLTPAQYKEHIRYRKELDALFSDMQRMMFPSIVDISMYESFLKAYSEKYLNASFELCDYCLP